MNVVVVLIRKHLLESRWLLGLSSVAFFGLSWLTVWMATRFERLIDLNELGRRGRMLMGLGGPAMDLSTTALEVCWWNHPVIVLTILAWAVTRASAAVAGEIERGTIDVTLSRPISRRAYLTSQILFAVLGLLLLGFSLIAGNVVASVFYTLKAPPTAWTLMKPAAMVVTLGMAVYGYALPLSAIDVVRWRPGLVASAVTLAGLVSMSVAPQFPDYQKLLENLSVFQLYAPVTVAMKGDPLSFNVTILLAVFLAGVVLSFFLFLRRNLPSNS